MLFGRDSDFHIMCTKLSKSWMNILVLGYILLRTSKSSSAKALHILAYNTDAELPALQDWNLTMEPKYSANFHFGKLGGSFMDTWL